MFTTYRRVLSVPGALVFSASAMVARLPISMVGLGIVLLVSSTTGSYGLAGAVSAVFLVANAVFSVAQGRLLDRLGQDRVLVPGVLAFVAALVLLMASVQLGWPHPVSYLAAAVSGASMPAVGAAVRARWSHVLRDPAQVQTAYALESVVDEAVFIVGPILVVALATAWHPLAGLTAAAAAGLAGTLAFAAQRRTQPPTHSPQAGGGARSAMPWRAMAAIFVVSVGLGGLFGAAEVSTVAFTEELGHKSWAGALLALWATGSLLAGIATGVVRWRRGPAVRLRYGAAAMAASMAPLSLIGSVPLLAVVLFVGGFATAPTLIAANSLTEQTVPRVRLAEGMAIVHTGIAAGVALGAALAGVLVDAHGASVAYLVPLVAGVVAAIAAQATPR